MLRDFTKVAVADLGWNKETFRVQYAIAFSYLSPPVLELLAHISATGFRESVFGFPKTSFYTPAYRRTAKLPNAQACMVCRAMKYVFKGTTEKGGPSMSDIVMNDSYRVCVYAALTVQQLYEELRSAKAAGEGVEWNVSQESTFNEVVTNLVTGSAFDEALKVAIKTLDLLNVGAAKDNLQIKCKSGTGYPRARKGYRGKGGFEIVYTNGSDPRADYTMDSWPSVLKARLLLCPLRKKKEAPTLTARVSLVNTADAKV